MVTVTMFFGLQRQTARRELSCTRSISSMAHRLKIYAKIYNWQNP